ncbi:MAG: hypothetical protein NAOJABEB_01134 [Steroidobacteraceae bacterium]|nr:hypothetical protein [Steroidobacteraceae bacterium]
MTMQSQAEVLHALAKGLDPSSGEALEATGVWREPGIAEALRAGAAALEARASRTPPPGAKQVGQPWTPQEEHRLLTAFAAGVALPDIASQHQRSLTAIEARLERLGKITAEQRVTRNRFTAA